jgi:arylsulfatase A-like enzyme
VTRPLNILLITTDEERFALPRPDGFTLPAHQRLAESGTTFTRYYAASTMCSSSRSVIYTGRHLPHTRVYDNDNMPYIRPLDPALGTLGTMLREQGYATTYQGKWHLSNSYVEPGSGTSTTDWLEPYGFSDWNDWGDIDGGAWAGLQVDPIIAGQAAGWLHNRAPLLGDQPWFMAVNFVNPHDIMSFDYGSRSDVHLPPALAHAVAVRPPADIPIYQRQWDVDLPTNLHDDLADAAPAVREYADVMDVSFGEVAGDDPWASGMNFYLNCIRDVDRNIGTVLDALASSGQTDRTMIVFLSDHGDLVGSHGLRQKGNLVYDENFHVPLLVVHPDVDGGGTCDSMASAVDLAPTLLEAAGLDAREIAESYPHLYGHSLMSTLDGGPGVRDGVLTAVETITTLDASYWSAFGQPDVVQRLQAGTLHPDLTKRGFLRGYTDERYSFGRYFAPLEPNRPRNVDRLFADNDVVLYDRLDDPSETTNLAALPAHRDLVADYAQRLESLIDAEVGSDVDAWVTTRPELGGAAA